MRPQQISYLAIFFFAFMVVPLAGTCTRGLVFAPTPSPAGTILVDGIYEIRSPTDIKAWHFGLQVGLIVSIEVGFYSLGTAFLEMQVMSPEIEFNLFRQNFTQSDSIGNIRAWKFAVPDTGTFEFKLSLLESLDFTVAVYVKIETMGFISNSYTQNAGPEKTPLCAACLFASDDVETGLFEILLNHDTLYWFSAVALTPFDCRYEEREQVKVWAYLESLGTGDRLEVAAGGILGTNILDWKSNWFGISKNGTYRLVVAIVANGTYRRGIGFSIAEYQAHGNSNYDDLLDPDSGDTTPNPFLSVENDIVLCAVVGGIVVVAAVTSKFSKRPENSTPGTVER